MSVIGGRKFLTTPLTPAIVAHATGATETLVAGWTGATVTAHVSTFVTVTPTTVILRSYGLRKGTVTVVCRIFPLLVVVENTIRVIFLREHGDRQNTVRKVPEDSNLRGHSIADALGCQDNPFAVSTGIGISNRLDVQLSDGGLFEEPVCSEFGQQVIVITKCCPDGLWTLVLFSGNTFFDGRDP